MMNRDCFLTLNPFIKMEEKELNDLDREDLKVYLGNDYLKNSFISLKD